MDIDLNMDLGTKAGMSTDVSSFLQFLDIIWQGGTKIYINASKFLNTSTID